MRWFVALAVVVLAGCGGAPETARLRFDQVHVENGRYLIDSKAIQYVEVRPTGAAKPSFVARLDQIDGSRSVAPGRYTVVSYSRDCLVPCDGSPSRYHSRHCLRRIRVADRQTVRLTITTRTGARCVVGR